MAIGDRDDPRGLASAVEQSDLPENRPALGHTGSGKCYKAAVRLDKTERNSNDDKA
jgi:hypothetical protein